VKQLKESLTMLSEALAERDVKTVRLTAHSIKGASKQIGASNIGELLGAIEREDCVEAVRKLLEQLEVEVPRVEEAVDALLRRSLRAS
jgi:HPt (histidine-containing phosphotransfer) domain-containing protein